MKRIAAGLFAVLSVLGGASHVFGADTEAEKELKSGSRAPYVHRLTLYDENGAAIDPRNELAAPYSPRMTCGKCHPCGQIAGGWHFNAERAGTAAGRPGEAWLLVDALTGTQAPVSGRGWSGVIRPADQGQSSWQFVKRFGPHTPGGCYGTPDEAELRGAPERARWAISGPLEIDCLFCHSADQQHDPAAAAAQIEAENFKWAPTAALGLAVIRGEARKAPDDWDPALPPNPDHPEQAGPRIIWNLARFDADDRVLFNVVRRPPNERCYFCHTTREVGPNAPDEERSCRDVHLTAGLLCVDCHRNGTDHMIARGYGTEAADRGDAGLAAFSCTGCHLGVEKAPEPELASGGRYAAPHPAHNGLPPVHLEKLTCTACHSGPWAKANTHRFQTSLAHGLGLATRERDADTPPAVLGPVFARQDDGKIAPQRLVWPAYWARLAGDKVEAYALDAVQKAIKKADPQRGKARGDKLAALTDEQIKAILEQLAKGSAGSTPAYVRDGILYRRSASGEMEKIAFEPPAEEDEGAPRQAEDPIQRAIAPYRWSFAHEVRPAAQSLGAGGCTDCHASGAPIYFGSIAATGVSSGPQAVQTMYRFRGEDGGRVQAWAMGFVFRPVFKWSALICAAVVALVLLRAVLAPAFPTAHDGTLVAIGAGRIEKLLLFCGFLGLAIQLGTGFGTKWTIGTTEGWALLVHMLGAPLFIMGVTGAAVFSAARRRASRGSQAGLQSVHAALFWLALLCGFAAMAPMLVAMTPLVSLAQQEWLRLVHEYAGLTLVALLVLYAGTAARSRARR